MLSDCIYACSPWSTGYFGSLVIRKIFCLHAMSVCPFQEERLALLFFVSFPQFSSECSPFSSLCLTWEKILTETVFLILFAFLRIRKTVFLILFAFPPLSLNSDKIRDRVWWNIHSFVYSPVLMTSPLGSWKNTCELLTGSCGCGKLVFLVYEDIYCHLSVFTITWSFIILGSRFEEVKTNSTIRWLYNCTVLLCFPESLWDSCFCSCTLPETLGNGNLLVVRQLRSLWSWM